MIRFSVTGEDGSEIASVETISTDSLYNMRDQIHNEMEDGEFGSRFPTFLPKFEPTEWSVEELPDLKKELQIIEEHFKTRGPEPHLASMPMWDDIREGKIASLYDVYKDAAGRPLIGSLLELCRIAIEAARPIQME